jgi:hypothetical protein
MLEDNDKLRIQLEEEYRREIRERLEAKPARSSRLWSFLNSAFALWLLSTVVVGMVGFVYERYDRAREARRTQGEKAAAVETQRSLTVQKLDAEISSRLNYFNRLLTDATTQTERRNRLARGLMALERPSEAVYPVGVFPEYANRSFHSLLWELLHNVQPAEKQALEPAYKQSTELPSIYLFESQSGSQSPASVKVTANSPVPWWGSDARMGQLVDQLVDQFVNMKNSQKLKAFNLDRWGQPLNGLLEQSRLKIEFFSPETIRDGFEKVAK